MKANINKRIANVLLLCLFVSCISGCTTITVKSSGGFGHVYAGTRCDLHAIWDVTDAPYDLWMAPIILVYSTLDFAADTIVLPVDIIISPRDNEYCGGPPISDIPSPGNDGATVTVVRANSFQGEAVRFFVSIDGVIVVGLRNKQYTSFAVSRGSHTIAVQWGFIYGNFFCI